MSKIALTPNASGTGTLTVAAPNTNTDRTITLPDATTTLVGTDATQTLSNKTLTGPLTVNANSASTAFNISQTGAGNAMLISGGNVDIMGSATQELSFTIGQGRTGNGYSYIDLVGDATYTDFGLRMIRENAGPNTNSYITHRGTGALLLTAQDAGTVVLATSNTERMRINASGNVLVGTSSVSNGAVFTVAGTVSASLTGRIYSLGTYNNTTSSGANLHIALDGHIFRSTSSLKYKTDVQDSTHGLVEVMTLRPVTYKGKNDGALIFGGLIAEEVHEAGLTEFVQYAEDGSPDALAYGNMVSLCIKAIQEQQQMIQALEARIAALEGV